MPIVPLGSQASSTAKTPTLKQYLKEISIEDNQSFPVTLIFLPSKYPNITLMCGDEFKVTVGIADSLHIIIMSNIDKWSQDMTTLTVSVIDENKGSWELGIDTDFQSTWEEKDYGYHIDELATNRVASDTKSTLEKTPKGKKAKTSTTYAQTNLLSDDPEKRRKTPQPPLE